MPVRAFVDDSGSGGDSTYFVLGGYLADFETWERFSDDWDAALKAPPAIEYFKSSQAESLKKQFDKNAGWTADTRDRKIDTLIDVINHHDPFQGSVAIRQDEYDAIVRPVLGHQFRGQYADPYLYLFVGVVTLFSAIELWWEYAKRGVPPGELVVFDADIHTGHKPQPVDYVFDEGKELTDREARTFYEASLKTFPRFHGRLGTVDFKDDKLFVPLQAADLSAWQRRRRLCFAREGTRRHYERLHKPGRFKHEQLDRKLLQQTIDLILSHLRENGDRP